MFVIFSLFFVSGASESVLITQWPRYISNRPNSSAEMHCYQNDTDYQYLYWYRKQRGKGLELMVVVVATISDFEEGFNSGFKAAASGKQWTLTISSVEEKDEAAYLCAATPEWDISFSESCFQMF
uniref:Ig-like domain-containing protein n=1 Tax=Stegastes partitus TaxID=144197 RepID=A0A3B5ATW8_9TELE